MYCIPSELFIINILTGVNSCKPEEEEPGRNFRDDRAGASILITMMMMMMIILMQMWMRLLPMQDDNKDKADEDHIDVDVFQDESVDVAS